jgi:hypothetical protein
MQIGDTYRDNNQTYIWSRCPMCFSERGVRKRSYIQIPQSLCPECNYIKSKREMAGLWDFKKAQI